VRSLMSVEPNAQWFGTPTTSWSHLLLPVLRHARGAVLLRAGPTRLSRGSGELARLASQQPAYLRKLASSARARANTSAALLQSALQSIVFLPFAAGTMTHFEHDLYEHDLPVANAEPLVAVRGHYQGVQPLASALQIYATLAPRPTSTTIRPSTTTTPWRP